MHINRAIREHRVLAMDGSDDLIARADESFTGREILQDPKFREREINLVSINKCFVTISINHERTTEKHDAIAIFARKLFRVATQYPFETSHEHAWAEWFRYVIVGAEFESSDDVRLFTLCSHHDDRNVSSLFRLLESTTHFESTEIWKHQVKHDEIWYLLANRFEREPAAVAGARDHAFALRMKLNEFSNLRLVFDNQDFRFGSSRRAHGSEVLVAPSWSARRVGGLPPLAIRSCEDRVQ